jgi:hypothetical protein
MKRAGIGIAALAATIGSPWRGGTRIAWADRVSVKVIEIAGDVAYIAPGATAGLKPEAKVAFGSSIGTIREVTAANASVKLDGLSLTVGQSGSVDVAPGPAAGNAAGAPLRADAVAGGWPELITPAQVQQVKRVPLGTTGRGKTRLHATVIAGGYAAASRNARSIDGEARVIASWDALENRPLAMDVDASGRAFTAGYDRQLRVPFFVRAAQLRYGSAADPRFALGRLRYAAASIGMLDGARGSIELGSLRVGAFGGIVPDPVSGKPDTSASRFGVEASYDAPEVAWQPRIAMVASGSTWQGALDERRLVLDFSAAHARTALSGWAEAQSFAASNPWGARAIELSGAGASAQWRDRTTRIGATVDFTRPERSLRLAAVLPPEWLCTRAAMPGTGSGEPCGSGDYTVTGTLSAGTRLGRVALDGYGMVGRTHLVSTTFDRSAYVRSEIAIAEHRVILGASAGKASFLSWNSAEGGLGTHIVSPLDLIVRYRGELLDYVGATAPVFQHSVIADAWYTVRATLDVKLSALATTGLDRDTVTLLTTFVWRPLP